MEDIDITVVLAIVVVIAGLAVGVFMFIRSRRTVEEAFSHFRCPKCRRRLRYVSRQVGHKGQCSHCHTQLVFPPLSQAID
jgi:cbb3-type cytochrome oxidase cytochrome c subunit